MKLRTTPVALLLAAVLAVGLVGCTSSGDKPPTGEALTELLEATGNVPVTAVEAKAIIEANTSLVIFDVRTAPEYTEGHLSGAYNLDYQAPSFAPALGSLSQTAAYLVYDKDADDWRAGAAADDMVRAGIIRVYSLEGGAMDWPDGLSQD
jgi:rhodanese-related sulfurtransferase